MEESGKKFHSLQFGTNRLKDGIILKDLVENHTAEFTLDIREHLKDELDELELDDLDNFGLFNNVTSCKMDIPFKIPFDELKMKMTNVTNDGKIKKLILRQGSGGTISYGSVVYLHYSCYLEMQDTPFDSSYLRDKPLRVVLGAATLYAGFEISLLSMKLNEYSQFLIESDYAFGNMGCPPRIPPNAALLLEIQLLKIVDGSEIDNIDAHIEDKDTFRDVSLKAKKYHLLGNDYYAKGEVIAAVDKYKKAENILLSCKMNSDEEETICRKLLFKIYTNLCVCYNHPKLKSPERVCLAAKEAFYFHPINAEKSAKLFFHLGKAQLAFQDYNKARRNLMKALSLEPRNKDIIDLMAELEKKRNKYYEHEKLSYQKAFQNQRTKPEDIEPHTDFVETFKEQLEELIKANVSKVQLPNGLTSKEKQICREIAEKEGLTYEEEIICGKCTTLIRK